jgi:WD40 repeat protein
MLHAVAVAPDGRHVATGDKVGHVAVWDTSTGRQVSAVEAPVMYTWDPTARRHSIGGVRALAFSPDGARLAVGGIGTCGNIDGLTGLARVEVFDWRKGERVWEFPGDQYKGLVESLVYHPGGDWLLAAGGAGDGFLMMFDPKSGTMLRQEKVGSHVYAAALSDAADRLYLAGYGKVLVYEAKA